MAGDPLMEQLVGDFLSEANDLVQDATRHILALERVKPGTRPPEGAHAAVGRALHTLKGSAATVGLSEISELAHRLEDLWAPVGTAREAVPSELADVLLRALDGSMEWLRARVAGRDVPDLGEIARGIQAAPVAAGASGPAARATPDAAAAAGEPGDEHAGWRVATRHVGALMQEIERLRELRLRLEQRARDVGRALEDLTRLGMFAQTAEARALLMGVRFAVTRDVADLVDLVEGLDGTIKEICTLPVRTLHEPLERAARDVCRARGKQATMSMVGGEISLDRRVLEALRGPLLHLVRNAADHGIEAPGARLAAGKAAEGAIVVRVEQQGNVAFVEVADDGGGLDAARIREAAERQGIVSRAELDRMDPAETMQLVFRAGFSTAEAVTEISGRGVGLDVVRAQVQALHGQVEVQSTPGQGSRFTLSVPTDIGASPLLLVRASGAVFGLPMLALERVVRARRDELHLARGQPRLDHEGHTLPLLDLGALAGLRQPLPPSEGQALLVIHVRGRRAAILVDDVLQDRELAIQPLPQELSGLAAFQGAAALADGDYVMVLRPEWLVDAEVRTQMTPSAKRALVVDDSLTARAMQRAMLEAGGYTVHAVASAAEAVARLEHTAYDVAICDVAMTGMDGLAFTRFVREHAQTRALPVVLISALDGDADREAGLAAGADAFVSKKNCAAGLLLSAVSAALARRSRA